jgi:hypothetical protein
MSIELERSVVQQLRRQAHARGLSLEAYLRRELERLDTGPADGHCIAD